jgi:hypothetical protein
MADYVPVTEFVTKDGLATNDPDKKVVGSELDAEFDAISVAIASKTDESLFGVGNGIATLNANAKLEPDQMWAHVNAPAIATAAVTMDCAVSNQFYVELTEDITVNAPTNPQNGQTIWIILQQDATGDWTVTWNAAFCFPAASAPTMTVTADKADLYVATYSATLTKWLVTVHQNYTVA